jgi:hypothetical protein
MTSSELQELTASEPLSLEEEYDMQGEHLEGVFHEAFSYRHLMDREVDS